MERQIWSSLDSSLNSFSVRPWRDPPPPVREVPPGLLRAALTEALSRAAGSGSTRNRVISVDPPQSFVLGTEDVDVTFWWDRRVTYEGLGGSVRGDVVAAPVSAAPAPAPAPARLAVGQWVRASPANRDGPLFPPGSATVGHIVTDDGSAVMPFKVDVGGRTHWYDASALEAVPGPRPAPPPPRVRALPPTLEIGTGVVRGPTWQWGEQDGGVGAVGVVVEPHSADDMWVRVRWPPPASSSERGYRYQPARDLADVMPAEPMGGQPDTLAATRAALAVAREETSRARQDAVTARQETVAARNAAGAVRVEMEVVRRLARDAEAGVAEARAAAAAARAGEAAARAEAARAGDRERRAVESLSSALAQLRALQGAGDDGGAPLLSPKYLGATCGLCGTEYEATGGSAPCELGPCGHALCLVCAARALEDPLTELLTSPPPAATYLAPLPRGGGGGGGGAVALPLPGLFCPVCNDSAKARRAAAEAHWRVFVAGLREKKRGVAWRLVVPRSPPAPWSAAWAHEDGRAAFELAYKVPSQPGEAPTVTASAGGAFLVPPGEGDFLVDVAVNGEGVWLWPSTAFSRVGGHGGGGGGGGSGGGGPQSLGSNARSLQATALAERLKQSTSHQTMAASGGALLLSHPFSPPLQPYQFRHLRLTLRGPVFLAPPAPPPAIPEGWLSPEALAAAATFCVSPLALTERIEPLNPAALRAAERAYSQLAVFLSSFAREEVGCADAPGLFGVVSGAPAPPPRLALRVRPASPLRGGGGGGGGGGEQGAEDAPFSPSLVAPVVCPNASCGMVLAVDVPASLGAGRGLHLSCVHCGTGLCGACGSPWVVAGSASAASHAGALCAEHVRALELAANAGADAALGERAGAVKRCPNPTCGAVIVRYRGHACHSVTCSKCHLQLCYVCLATPEERQLPSHEGCPSTCSDACDCVPCPECASGRPCDHCDGAFSPRNPARAKTLSPHPHPHPNSPQAGS